MAKPCLRGYSNLRGWEKPEAMWTGCSSASLRPIMLRVYEIDNLLFNAVFQVLGVYLSCDPHRRAPAEPAQAVRAILRGKSCR
jgi:hypothetical protein